jgi:hypothetical protein
MFKSATLFFPQVILLVQKQTCNGSAIIWRTLLDVYSPVQQGMLLERCQGYSSVTTFRSGWRQHASDSDDRGLSSPADRTAASHQGTRFRRVISNVGHLCVIPLFVRWVIYCRYCEGRELIEFLDRPRLVVSATPRSRMDGCKRRGNCQSLCLRSVLQKISSSRAGVLHPHNLVFSVTWPSRYAKLMQNFNAVRRSDTEEHYAVWSFHSRFQVSSRGWEIVSAP